jgi:hypothetical protein
MENPAIAAAEVFLTVSGFIDMVELPEADSIVGVINIRLVWSVRL